jgi:hypothetical protein
MRRPFCRWAGVLLVLMTASLGYGEDSPLQKAAVGDWVEFQGISPKLGGLPGTDAAVSIRYTVKAKTDKTATLNVKSSTGEFETSNSDFELPLDQPLDASALMPTRGEKGSFKLDRTIPNLKYKIKGKEFQGTGVQYKAELDLFSGLGLPKGDESAPKPEMAVVYFVTPQAPVLGVAMFTVKGFVPVRFELTDGTGVSELLYPPRPPAPLAYKVGDWMEYRGVNEKDEREIVLRHTVQAIAEGKTTIVATLTVAGNEEESWEFDLHDPNGLAAAPRWKEFGDILKASSLQSPASSAVRFEVLDGVRLKGDETSHEIMLDPKAREKGWVGLGRCSELPLTGLARISLQNNTGIRVKLALASHSGFVDVKGERPRSATKRKPNTKEATPDNAEDKPKAKPNEKTKSKAKPRVSAKSPRS